MLSARGSQREAARLGGGGGGALTPRPSSSLKLAGLDLSSASKQQADNQPAVPPKSGRKGVDTVPHLMVSGKRGEVAPWSCEPEIIAPTPRTPEGRGEIQTRHKRRTEPGEITVHWGLKSTRPPAAGDGYGIRSNKGENVEQNFQSGQKLGIAEYVQSRGESIYKTVQCEPLGGSWVRGHVLPEATKRDDFKGFGKALEMDNFDAKETIFPRYMDPEADDDRARYKKTHGAFDPGEGVDRNYVWPDNISSNQHFRFGVTDQERVGSLSTGGGAKAALSMDCEEDRSFPRTTVVKRTSENYRHVANDQLGTSRNLLQGRPPVPVGHAYGLKSGADLTHAGELVRGFYTPKEQQPDHDLGRCAVKGRRNFATRRPFGVPSIRDDLEAPPLHKRQVASCINYGDDHSAYTLIYPQKFGFRGVSDDDFLNRRPADEIRSLMAGAGYEVSDEDFLTVWNACVEAYGDDHKFVSLEVFLNFFSSWTSQTGGTKRVRAATREEPQQSTLESTALAEPALERTQLAESALECAA